MCYLWSNRAIIIFIHDVDMIVVGIVIIRRLVIDIDAVNQLDNSDEMTQRSTSMSRAIHAETGHYFISLRNDHVGWRILLIPT